MFGCSATPMWVVLLSATSITMTVGNKFAARAFEFATVLTLLQNGTAVLVLGALGAAGAIDVRPVTRQQVAVFSVNALLLALQIVSSLRALPRVAIATAVVFRTLNAVAVAVVEYAVRGKRLSGAAMLALLTTVLGMVIFAGSDHAFDAEGYAWLLANSAGSVGNFMWNKWAITKYDRADEGTKQTAVGVALVQQSVTIPILLLLAAASGDVAVAAQRLVALSRTEAAAVVLTCLGGIFIPVCYARCFALLSSTSVAVASTANKAMSIGFGLLIFGTALNTAQVGGLVICIGGALWYTVEKKRAPSPEEATGNRGSDVGRTTREKGTAAARMRKKEE